MSEQFLNGTSAQYRLRSAIPLKLHKKFERQKLIKKSRPTQKLKHANSILESFEYFFQISSKSIVIILSYTVSKLARFLRHSVEFCAV